MVKKFISIVVVLAAIFCAVPMRGDSPPEFTIEIPNKNLVLMILFGASMRSRHAIMVCSQQFTHL